MTTLTARHKDILKLMAEGLTMKAIGERLGVKPSTVESHRRVMARRMGAKTTAQMVVMACRQGLI